MNTDRYGDTLPDIARLPRGYFVTSNVADRMLEFGKDGEVWGDAIPQDDLDMLVEDARNDEAIGDCDRCGDSVLKTDGWRAIHNGETLLGGCCA